MTARYPGARWFGQPGQGKKCTHRSCSWHEAVTTGGVDAVASWNATAGACHGFTGKDGDAGQYVDFGTTVAGVYNGNGQVVTWENWDGLLVATNRSPDGSFGPNDIGWTPQQFERNADIMAWMVDGLGIPLHMMQNTEQPGHGPHRLGVPKASGRVQLNYGPTQWTTHPGKQCPGDVRIEQMPAMIERAKVILAAARGGRCTWLPTGPVNLAAALARTAGIAKTGIAPATTDIDDEDDDMAMTPAELDAFAERVAVKLFAKLNVKSLVNEAVLTLPQAVAYINADAYAIRETIEADRVVKSLVNGAEMSASQMLEHTNSGVDALLVKAGLK